MELIRSFKELRVYKMSFEASMQIFELTKEFPKEEKYALTDQIRRSSRSVSANLAEAFVRRIYPKSFVLRINDAEAEAAETITWLDYAYKCRYIREEQLQVMTDEYNSILRMLTNMRINFKKWAL